MEGGGKMFTKGLTQRKQRERSPMDDKYDVQVWLEVDVQYGFFWKVECQIVHSINSV